MATRSRRSVAAIAAILLACSCLAVSVSAIGISPPTGRTDPITGETLINATTGQPLPPQKNGVDILNFQNIVFSQLQYVSITKIDGVEQSFTSDFYMYSVWAAPKAPGWTVNDDLSDATNIQPKYWFPQLDFINAIGGVTALVDTPYSFISEADLYSNFNPATNYPDFVLPDNWVFCVCDQRYFAAFLTPVSMERFPYDQQRAMLLMESFWTTDLMKLVFAEPNRMQLQYLFPPTMPEILGWRPVRAETKNHDIQYDYTRTVFNRQELAIVMNRIPDFYINKLVSGCVMLIAMSVSLFLLTAEEADRLMGALAIFAGLVAYLFVASVYTPVLPYSTALDQFLMLCFVSVIAQSAVHAVMFYAREREKLQEEKELLEKEKACASSDDDDDDEEGDETDRHPQPQTAPSSHSSGFVGVNGNGNGNGKSLHTISVHGVVDSPHPLPGHGGDQPGTEMAQLNGGAGSSRRASRQNTIAPLPLPLPEHPASPSVVDRGLVQDGQPSSARVRHNTFGGGRHAVLGTSSSGAVVGGHHHGTTGAEDNKPPKKLNKRDRKRARKREAMALQASQAVVQVHITNSMNPVRIWWASLGLTTIRKLDVFWFCFFSLTFVLATALIFGIAERN